MENINPFNCSRTDLIYYLITYKYRFDNVPQDVLDNQFRYAVQLLTQELLQNVYGKQQGE